MLASGAGAVALAPAARVAWQQEPAGVVVFVNGEVSSFGESVLDCLMVLCKGDQLAGGVLADHLARPETVSLLDYLLETGGIYVE